MKYKKICYLVLVYNELEYTIKTFESLQKQRQEKYSFDVICVDNASVEKYAQPLRDYCQNHNIRYIHHDVNDGYAGGNNYAFNIVKSEGYEIVFIANNDIELLHPDITENIIDCFETNDRIALIGTPIVDADNNTCGKSLFIQLLAKLEKQIQYENDFFYTTPFVFGCFFAIRTDINKISYLFDYSYFMYCEEQKLEFQLMKWGYYVGVLRDSNKKVKHYGGVFDYKKQSDWSIYLIVRNYILSSKDYRFITKLFFYVSYFGLITKLAILNKKNTFRGYWAGLYLLITKKNSEYIYNDAVSYVKKIGGSTRKS